MISVWRKDEQHPQFKSLDGDITADVLVIGGGITGLLCAYKLKKAGVNCAVAEADRIMGGVTGNTTAKITSQHGLIYHKLIKEFGTEKARMYLEANQKAVSEYRKLAEDMDCNFENKAAYIYSLDSVHEMEKELDALHKVRFSASYVSRTGLPFDVKGAIKFLDQAQFNPLKFLENIAKELDIYEKTRVLGIDEMKAVTEHGSIKARNIIVATHFPFLNKHGSYFLKMFQERSYAAAIKNASDVDGMYIDGSGNGLSFRNYKEYLIIGGGSHRTGKSPHGSRDDHRNEKCGCWKSIEDFAKEYYPDHKISYKWAAQDCITLDGVPYIGQYSSMTPGLYVATGFNKWGMSSSMAAAMILTDMITGRENEYAPVFSPSRTMMRKQLFINGFEAAKNLMTPTTKRCSHLGCALKWNADEHSWDCQCHGSRFSDDGKVINEPAQRNIKA